MQNVHKNSPSYFFPYLLFMPQLLKTTSPLTGLLSFLLLRSVIANLLINTIDSQSPQYLSYWQESTMPSRIFQKSPPRPLRYSTICVSYFECVRLFFFSFPWYKEGCYYLLYLKVEGKGRMCNGELKPFLLGKGYIPLRKNGVN